MTCPSFLGSTVLRRSWVTRITSYNVCYTKLLRGQVIFYDQIIPGSTLLGYLNADHWAAAVPIAAEHPFIGRHFVDQNDFPREAIAEALMRFVEEDLARRD